MNVAYMTSTEGLVYYLIIQCIILYNILDINMCKAQVHVFVSIMWIPYSIVQYIIIHKDEHDVV